MINTPISLHDLRERIYIKAKADKAWRFWGLYVHVCKLDTLLEAYLMARKNNGAPGIDGVTFEAIEESGVQEFLEQIRNELVFETYQPAPNRKKEIPKGGGKIPHFGHSLYPRPGRPGYPQAHSGTHLRSGFPRGVIWVPPRAKSPRRRQESRWVCILREDDSYRR